MTGNDEWISGPAAAAELGITYATFYRWIKTGKGPTVYRFGRVFRIRRTDLYDFIESLRVEPGSLDHLDNNNG